MRFKQFCLKPNKWFYEHLYRCINYVHGVSLLLSYYIAMHFIYTYLYRHAKLHGYIHETTKDLKVKQKNIYWASLLRLFYFSWKMSVQKHVRQDSHSILLIGSTEEKLSTTLTLHFIIITSLRLFKISSICTTLKL